ncbi:MAG: hypothetical protein H0U76_25505 [Ktedonobacteraceae bacterium]|nr:hypothetical protein [Ktedonobacteraceae bacterium]
MDQKRVELKRQFSAKRVILDGSIFSGLIGTLIVGSLSYNAEMWHGHYPRDIQEKAGPMSQRAKRQRRFFALPFVVIFFGMPLSSTLKLKRQNKGTLSFLTAFLHAYALFGFATFFDIPVLYSLLIVLWQPDFVVLAGTKGMASYHEYAFPLVGFLKGLGIALVPSLLIAFLTSSKRAKGLHEAL